MKKILALIMGAVIVLSGCSKDRLQYYEGDLPNFDIKTFFTGEIKAWGIIQDWRGRVVTRFDADMVGTWDGDVGTLKEKFEYYDGRTQRRTWVIKKNSDGTYTGTADDIIDSATGLQQGSAMNWSYRMDVPVDGGSYRLTFDDWMWQMNDGIVVNRSYMKKFGITVAELTLFMQKQ